MPIKAEPLIPAGLAELSWAGTGVCSSSSHHLGQDFTGNPGVLAQVRGLCWGFAAAEASPVNKWVWQKVLGKVSALH